MAQWQVKNIQVKVNAGILLSRFSVLFPKDKIEIIMDLPPGSTVKDVIAKTGIPLSYISFPLVNGQKKELNFHINTGDEIILLPYVTGG